MKNMNIFVISSKRILYYLGYQVEVLGVSYANMYLLQSNAGITILAGIKKFWPEL
uniref:Uncharacterized protein n=1 Tax=Rhizophagus irregularis (strain DAOM 181602 / DAOM 197198 / MUCL 43194) TaxID=747089 RepID=U9UAW7_RHIID